MNIVWSLVSVNVCFARAPQPIVLTDENFQNLAGELFVLHDYQSEYEVDSFLASEALLRAFEPPENGVLNFGFIDHVVWLQFVIQSPANDQFPDSKKSYYLEIASPLMDVCELYRIKDGMVEHFSQSDIRITMSERELANVNSVFPIEMKPGETHHYLVKLKNKGFSDCFFVSYGYSTYSTILLA